MKYMTNQTTVALIYADEKVAVSQIGANKRYKASVIKRLQLACWQKVGIFFVHFVPLVGKHLPTATV